MTINYTTLLGLAKPVTGTETGQWGDVVNDEITSLLEDAVANAATFSVTSGNVTLTTTNGASNQARMSTLIITGSPGTTRNVIAPSQAKIYQVINQSDGDVVIKGSATTGVTIAAGATGTVVWNGSDFVEVNSTSSGRIIKGNLQVTGNLQVDGNTTLGNAVGDTITVNGALTFANATPVLSTETANGVLYLNGSKQVGANSALAFNGSNTLSLSAVAPTFSVTANTGGTATLSLVSTGNYGWSIQGTSSKMGFLRDSTEIWFWNATGLIPSSNVAYNLGSNSSGSWNNLYINYIKPVGGSSYTSTAFIDLYPATNTAFYFHSGTTGHDFWMGNAGNVGGGIASETVAYQTALVSAGTGFLFSTATSGGKLLSLTASGVGIGKNSASYALDIIPAATTDGIYMRMSGSSGRAFNATGDGVVSWGNGSTDYGVLSWDTGTTIVVAKNQLVFRTNNGLVEPLILSTAGNASFAGNVSITAGGNAYLTGSLGSRLWTPGLAIGTGVYSGLYGPSLTYLAERSGSSWVSSGGGTAGALGIDEGYFYFARSNGVGGPGSALTWTTYLESGNAGDFSFNSTGFTRIARGSTAQRPGTQGTGQLRWNTTYPQLEVSDGTSFHKVVTEPIVLSASGGTISTDGDYKIHTFNSSGTFTLTTISGATKVLVQILLVGGGGGGGFYLGGGGGGGAMLETFVELTTGSYTVTVGAGGTSTSASTGYSGNGGQSTFNGGILNLYALGGGAGSNGTSDAFGANGSANTEIGCGGGGASPYGFGFNVGTIHAMFGGPAGVNGSGGAFGTIYSSLTFTGGGGGGGALGAGVAPNVGNGPVGAGGYGGRARPSSITGNSVFYAGGGGGGYGTYLANQAIGGGTGGGQGVGTAGSGANLQATAGSANLGGGGGGGQAFSGYERGGSGGSGVVIIRYKYQ